MSFLKGTFDGLDAALRGLDATAARVDKATGNAMLKLAQKVADQAVHEITTQGQSRPGTPPASRTGALANSIVARLINETASEVLVNADYAKHVELGTRKMFEHPFMRLAIAIVLPEFSMAEQLALFVAIDQLNKHKDDPSGFFGSIAPSMLK